MKRIYLILVAILTLGLYASGQNFFMVLAEQSLKNEKIAITIDTERSAVSGQDLTCLNLTHIMVPKILKEEP